MGCVPEAPAVACRDSALPALHWLLTEAQTSCAHGRGLLLMAMFVLGQTGSLSSPGWDGLGVPLQGSREAPFLLVLLWKPGGAPWHPIPPPWVCPGSSGIPPASLSSLHPSCLLCSSACAWGDSGVSEGTDQELTPRASVILRAVLAPGLCRVGLSPFRLVSDPTAAQSGWKQSCLLEGGPSACRRVPGACGQREGHPWAASHVTLRTPQASTSC